MKLVNIRSNSFETNSSSSHSLIIPTDANYNNKVLGNFDGIIENIDFDYDLIEKKEEYLLSTPKYKFIYLYKEWLGQSRVISIEEWLDKFTETAKKYFSNLPEIRIIESKDDWSNLDEIYEWSGNEDLDKNHLDFEWMVNLVFCPDLRIFISYNGWTTFSKLFDMRYDVEEYSPSDFTKEKYDAVLDKAVVL